MVAMRQDCEIKCHCVCWLDLQNAVREYAGEYDVVGRMLNILHGPRGIVCGDNENNSWKMWEDFLYDWSKYINS